MDGVAMETNYEEYYKSQLENSLEFQDFVSDVLYSIGIVINNYNSKKYQTTKGENRIGIEIKNDKKFNETGNLYIELKEKSNPLNNNYVLSGINRRDNSWLYIIGDQKTLYIFDLKTLLRLSEKFNVIENKTKTSMGFLLPISEADKFNIRKINIP